MSMIKKISILIIALVGIVVIGYSGVWFYTGSKIKNAVSIEQADLGDSAQDVNIENVKVTLAGFPNEFIVTWSGDIKTDDAHIHIPALQAQSWFAFGKPIKISAPLGLQVSMKDQPPVKIDNFSLDVSLPPTWPGHESGKQALSLWQTENEQLTINDLHLASETIGFNLNSSGYLTLDKNLQPAGVIQIKFNDISFIEKKKVELKAYIEQNHETMTKDDKKKVLRQMATLAAFTSAKDMEYTIKILKNSVYISFLKLMQFPFINWPDPFSESANAMGISAP
ncbi:MAG: hypothetical protein NZ828_02410 [Alphaproteobacteria bacterium]|nr:hypothetical protein [Alphaproteobacteria bacterium]